MAALCVRVGGGREGNLLVDLPFARRAVGAALAPSVLKFDGNLLGSGGRGAPAGVGSS
jgi:hypothetical protein